MNLQALKLRVPLPACKLYRLHSLEFERHHCRCRHTTREPVPERLTSNISYQLIPDVMDCQRNGQVIDGEGSRFLAAAVSSVCRPSSVTVTLPARCRSSWGYVYYEGGRASGCNGKCTNLRAPVRFENEIIIKGTLYRDRGALRCGDVYKSQVVEMCQ